MQFYDLNQANYALLPTLTENEINISKNMLQAFLEDHAGSYFMLLNNELHYYSLFVKNSDTDEWYSKLPNEIIEILEELGEIKSIEPSYDGNGYEFWIKNNEGNCHCYFLFNYDRGVVLV